MSTIVRMIFGSHLYGTTTPESDLDYKSIRIPTAREILLGKVKSSVKINARPKEGREKNLPGDHDEECFSLDKYLDMLASGQTGAIDMLFAPDDMIYSGSELWDYIKAHQRRFVTKGSAAFIGYCQQQAGKYGVKGERVEAARLASEHFTAAMALWGTTHKVGETEDVLHSLASVSEHIQIVQKETQPGRIETYFECCNRKIGFKNTLKEAAALYSRVYEGYGARARKAEQAAGVDWKAVSHAVRVGHEAIELLTTGKVTFPLPNADYVRAIKMGQLPFKPVAEEIEQLLIDVERYALTSPLREKADYDFIDNIVEREYRKTVVKQALELGIAA